MKSEFDKRIEELMYLRDKSRDDNLWSNFNNAIEGMKEGRELTIKEYKKKINSRIELCKGTLLEIKTIDDVKLNNEIRRIDWNQFIHILEILKTKQKENVRTK